jgi:hypothetical protein
LFLKLEYITVYIHWLAGPYPIVGLRVIHPVTIEVVIKKKIKEYREQILQNFGYTTNSLIKHLQVIIRNALNIKVFAHEKIEKVT